MSLPKNEEIKKITNAPYRILGASAAAFLSMLLMANWPFVSVFSIRHPGIIAVLVAVVGEVYFDWREANDKHSRWKKFFMLLIVSGLAYELKEAAEEDVKVGHLEKQTADLVSSNLNLALIIEGLHSENSRLTAQVKQAEKSAADAAAQTAGQQRVRTVTALAWFRTADPVSLTNRDGVHCLAKIEFSNFKTMSERIGVKLSTEQIGTVNDMSGEGRPDGPVNEFWVPFHWDLTQQDVIGVKGDDEKFVAKDLVDKIECLKMKLMFLSPSTHIVGGSVAITINSLLDMHFAIPDQVLDENRTLTSRWLPYPTYETVLFKADEIRWTNDPPILKGR